MTPAHDVSRIAVLKPCCLGDCVMALPALDALEAAFPSANIDVFVGQHSQAAFTFRPSVTIRTIPDRLTAGAALQLSRRLREGRYDIVVNLDRSRWLRLATRSARASRTASVQVLTPEVRHEAEVYVDAVRELRVTTPIVVPVIHASETARQRATETLANVSNRFVILHPGGASNPGATMLDKRWPAVSYSELAKLLTRQGLDVLLSGSEAERELCLSIARNAGLTDHAVLAGRVTLDELAAILERASLFVGPDTGVSHIAAATGAPTVAIFGPTNPRRYRPLGPHTRVVAPAESWHVMDRDLRRATSLELPSTSAVSVDEVFAASQDVLDARATKCRR